MPNLGSIETFRLSPQSRTLLSYFGVVLMSCKVNFRVVRSALHYSACRIQYV